MRTRRQVANMVNREVAYVVKYPGSAQCALAPYWSNEFGRKDSPLYGWSWRPRSIKTSHGNVLYSSTMLSRTRSRLPCVLLAGNEESQDRGECRHRCEGTRVQIKRRCVTIE